MMLSTLPLAPRYVVWMTCFLLMLLICYPESEARKRSQKYLHLLQSLSTDNWNRRIFEKTLFSMLMLLGLICTLFPSIRAAGIGVLVVSLASYLSSLGRILIFKAYRFRLFVNLSWGICLILGYSYPSFLVVAVALYAVQTAGWYDMPHDLYIELIQKYPIIDYGESEQEQEGQTEE